MMHPINRDSEIHKKTASARAAAVKRPARRSDFRARNVPINQSTSEPTNESTNEPTKRIFGSSCAKARCARRKPISRNELRLARQYQVSAQGHKKSLSERGLKRIQYTRPRPESPAAGRGTIIAVDSTGEYVARSRLGPAQWR
jgi:hypothetical protein